MSIGIGILQRGPHQKHRAQRQLLLVPYSFKQAHNEVLIYNNNNGICKSPNCQRIQGPEERRSRQNTDQTTSYEEEKGGFQSMFEGWDTV